MDIGQAGGVGGPKGIPNQQQLPEQVADTSTQKTTEVDQRIETREAVSQQRVAESQTSSKQESRPRVSDDIGRALAQQALERPDNRERAAQPIEDDSKDSRNSKVSRDGVNENQKTRVSF